MNEGNLLQIDFFIMHRAMIETLQAENVDLKKNLGLTTSRQNEIRDKLIADKFEELLANQGKKKKGNRNRGGG